MIEMYFIDVEFKKKNILVCVVTPDNEHVLLNNDKKIPKNHLPPHLIQLDTMIEMYFIYVKV